MGGHDLKLNMIINYGKQLGRSLLLLAHYTTVFVIFVSRSVSCFVEVIKWMSMFARYTVEVFESIHRSLNWWTRRCSRTSIEMLSSSDTESEWERTLWTQRMVFLAKHTSWRNRFSMDLKWSYRLQGEQYHRILWLVRWVSIICSLQRAHWKQWG